MTTTSILTEAIKAMISSRLGKIHMAQGFSLAPLFFDIYFESGVRVRQRITSFMFHDNIIDWSPITEVTDSAGAPLFHSDGHGLSIGDAIYIYRSLAYGGHPTSVRTVIAGGLTADEFKTSQDTVFYGDESCYWSHKYPAIDADGNEYVEVTMYTELPAWHTNEYSATADDTIEQIVITGFSGAIYNTLTFDPVLTKSPGKRYRLSVKWRFRNDLENSIESVVTYEGLRIMARTTMIGGRGGCWFSSGECISIGVGATAENAPTSTDLYDETTRVPATAVGIPNYGVVKFVAEVPGNILTKALDTDEVTIEETGIETKFTEVMSNENNTITSGDNEYSYDWIEVPITSGVPAPLTTTIVDADGVTADGSNIVSISDVYSIGNKEIYPSVGFSGVTVKRVLSYVGNISTAKRRGPSVDDLMELLTQWELTDVELETFFSRFPDQFLDPQTEEVELFYEKKENVFTTKSAHRKQKSRKTVERAMAKGNGKYVYTMLGLKASADLLSATYASSATFECLARLLYYLPDGQQIKSLDRTDLECFLYINKGTAGDEQKDFWIKLVPADSYVTLEGKFETFYRFFLQIPNDNDAYDINDVFDDDYMAYVVLRSNKTISDEQYPSIDVRYTRMLLTPSADLVYDDIKPNDGYIVRHLEGRDYSWTKGDNHIHWLTATSAAGEPPKYPVEIETPDTDMRGLVRIYYVYDDSVTQARGTNISADNFSPIVTHKDKLFITKEIQIERE